VIACLSKGKANQTFTKSKTLPCSVNENLIKAYQKTEVLNPNPMRIPSGPIRKERICRNLTEALGESFDFWFSTAKTW